MILIDANLLLYAYDPSAPQHEPAKSWFRHVMQTEARVGLPWASILAFLRISTHSRVARPISLQAAVATVDDWLAQPTVLVLEPGERYWSILRRLIPEAQARGPLVSDAHLAALAIEHGAVLCTNDRDFARFADLRWMNPLTTA